MNRRIYAIVIILISIPAALIGYRVFYLEYPLFPSAPQRVWHLSMDAIATDGQDGTSFMVGLPSSKHGITLLEEKISEGNLWFRLFSEGTNRFGNWSGTAGPDGGFVSYHATLLPKPWNPPPPSEPGQYPKGTSRQEQFLAERLMSHKRNLPLHELLHAVDDIISGRKNVSPDQSENAEAWTEIQRRIGDIKARLILLRAAGINARAMSGLKLHEGVTSDILTWIEVWTGTEWQAWQPGLGLQLKPSSLLPLIAGTQPVVLPLKGEITTIRWTLTRNIISQWDLQYERIGRSDRLLDRWSLFRLPQEYQGTLRILILVPLGALMVCVLRNVIGFPTFGIFMPVLMALAFRNTGLGYGLGIFGIVLILGYSARRSLENIRLLLVPRLSVILTFVIACFIIFALVGNKFELKAFMAIGLLPFVILTMAIERFFIIVEEEGIRKGFSTALGSAAVAAITYAIIQFEPLQITFFVYPELLLVVMAAEVLLGRYTGYRLSEFLRFRNLRGE